MRMWMLNPRMLCRKHLLGEHGELHKHRHNFVKRHSVTGRRGQIEPLAMQARHDELAAEMLARGYNHKSPYEMPDLSHLPDCDRLGTVDRVASLHLLTMVCADCRARIAAARK